MSNLCQGSGKVMYTSPRKAKEAAGRNRAGDRVYTYLCPICKRYHLTSMNKGAQ